MKSPVSFSEFGLKYIDYLSAVEHSSSNIWPLITESFKIVDQTTQLSSLGGLDWISTETNIEIWNKYKNKKKKKFIFLKLNSSSSSIFMNKKVYFSVDHLAWERIIKNGQQT